MVSCGGDKIRRRRRRSRRETRGVVLWCRTFFFQSLVVSCAVVPLEQVV